MGAGDPGLGIDNPLKGLGGKWNLQDGVGSITGQVDPTTGAISARQSFGPFGEEAANNAGGSGFAGRDRVGNGILYFRNRMYSPLLGRFLSEDPIGFSGSPDGNFFAYCGNDPVNFSDPLGLSPLSDGLMTGVAGLADGGVDAISFLGDPNQWNNYGWTILPDEYNPGAQLRKWYRDYTAPTYGSYRCMEGYGVSHGLAEFGAGVVFTHSAGMALEGVGALRAGAGVANEASPTVTPIGRGTVYETKAPRPVKPQDATNKWEEFLGEGPYTNTNPRTGLPDGDRLVSRDGLRSIRYTKSDAGKPGSKPFLHHYHEETWHHNPDTGLMDVYNNCTDDFEFPVFLSGRKQAILSLS